MIRHADARRARSAAPRFELIGDPIFQAAAWRRDCSAADGAPSATVAHAARAAPNWTESLPRLPGSRTEVLAIADLARAILACEPHRRTSGVSWQRRAPCAPLTSPGPICCTSRRTATSMRCARACRRSRSRANPRRHSADGVFGLLDILDARASARLVVLSACDTSRGRLLPGEGVLGPAQAFLQSGAASVIASYWRIDDAATAAFMRTFYKYLLTDHLPAATALRRAQLEHAAIGRAHDWAGFALFGWPDGAL